MCCPKQQHMQTHMALLICSPLNERENGETRRTRVPSASCVGQYTAEATFFPLNLSFPQSHLPLSGRHKSHGLKRRLATSDIKTTRRLKFMISRRAMPHKWKANWCQTRGACGALDLCSVLTHRPVSNPCLRPKTSQNGTQSLWAESNSERQTTHAQTTQEEQESL